MRKTAVDVEKRQADGAVRREGSACRFRVGITVTALLMGVAGTVRGQAPPTAPAGVAGPTDTGAPFAFRDITVVDVRDGRRHANQTVVVVGHQIHAIGPTEKIRLPQGTQVLPARGKYLIPGLWDMHVHVGMTGSRDLALQSALYRATYPLFVAYGVTGIQEMAQRFPHGADSFRVWQREVMEGRVVGPRSVGPSADLDYYLSSGGQLATPDDAHRVIDSLKTAGDAFVKYHGGKAIGTDLYFALLREARRVGLPVVGHHPPYSIASLPEAADSGQRSFEHMMPLPCFKDHKPGTGVPVFSEAPGPVQLDTAQCAAWARQWARDDVWAAPTLAFSLSLRNTVTASANEFFTAKLTKAVMPIAIARARWPDDFAARINIPVVRAIRFLPQAGIQLLVGTDITPTHFPLPGFALQQELIMLVEAAGLTPLEALQSATLNPAKFFEATDSLGTVAPGKLADLVLLDADPLADIRHIAAINAVVANGRYFERAMLDSVRARAERAWPASK